MFFKSATIPRKMFTMWKLSSYCRHIRIQDGRHIIRHAVFHDREMSLTLSVITENVVISPFRSEGSNCSISRWRLHCRSFSVSLRIPRYLSTYRSSSRLRIAGPTTFAKWGTFQVCLETIAIPLARLSTFARYQFKASYLSDTQRGPFRNITGSFGCLPSPISNVWKFRLYFQWLSPRVPRLVGWSLNMLV